MANLESNMIQWKSCHDYYVMGHILVTISVPFGCVIGQPMCQLTVSRFHYCGETYFRLQWQPKSKLLVIMWFIILYFYRSFTVYKSVEHAHCLVLSQFVVFFSWFLLFWFIFLYHKMTLEDYKVGCLWSWVFFIWIHLLFF